MRAFQPKIIKPNIYGFYVIHKYFFVNMSFTYDNSEILKQYQPKIIKPKICGIYVFHISRSCNKRAVPNKSNWFICRAHIKSCFNMRALPS